MTPGRGAVRRGAVLGRHRRLLALSDGTPPGPAVLDQEPAELGVPALLDLLGAACGVGASIPRALDVVGDAVGGRRGAALMAAAEAVRLGAPWDQAWSGAPDWCLPVAEALRSSWEDGVAPAGALRTAAEVLRRDQQSQATEAAARLGVRLVLPLGLCYLPAFVLVGLVPVLLSMARATLGP